MSDYAQSFITHLAHLRESDRGALAGLRRSLGFAPGSYPPAYPYVERFAAAEWHAQDARRLALYLVAGLYALNPRHADGSLASSLGELMRKNESASIEQRFIALLSADAENLSVYLRQVVSLLASTESGLDYARLLNDLSRLLDPRLDPDWRDAIRQRWARDFYRVLVSRDAGTPPSVTQTDIA
ncbi:CRISPR type I-E/ECOLI-associated protein CasB/Cse2 [compost metagenome]